MSIPKILRLWGGESIFPSNNFEKYFVLKAVLTKYIALAVCFSVAETHTDFVRDTINIHNYICLQICR